MIRSMTGFGRADAAGERLMVSVEVRSVNHRHLDLAFKMPRLVHPLEGDARRLVQQRIERGRVEIHVSVAAVGGQATQAVAVDLALARRYIDLGRRLAEDLALDPTLDLRWVLERPGVMRIDDIDALASDAVGPLFTEALTRALDELGTRRETEGDVLAAALRTLHETLVAELSRMAERAPGAAARRETRLRERLRALLIDASVDQGRLLTEVATWAEKTDIAEELTRLRAHLEQFALMLKEGGAIGRPLDFLTQEMNREVNTIAAKADDLELSQSAIAAKGMLEKVREQAQNLE
jgi:uncharacterized protein (TIGR00255 family)